MQGIHMPCDQSYSTYSYSEAAHYKHSYSKHKHLKQTVSKKIDQPLNIHIYQMLL